MNKEKKMNTYVKYGLILLACVAGGAILGAVSSAAEEGVGFFANAAIGCTNFLRKHLLTELEIILLIEIIAGEVIIRKLKKLAREAEGAEDEVGDRIDYAMEKVGAVGNGIISISAFLAMVVVATGYSKNYMVSLDKDALLKLLAAFIVFLIIYVYNGYWGVRMIKCSQKIDPSKKGDPASLKFQQQYVESCDEAEKQLIYHSAFHSFVTMSNWSSIVLVLAMIMHLLWNTGITAIVLVGILQLLQTLSYLKYAVMKKGEKLNV